MGQATRQQLRLSSGANLSFLTAGAPTRPAVLLLHGFPQSARAFRDVLSGLSRAAFVVAPDLPGFGESDPLPRASFPALARAVAELVTHLDVGPRYIYLHDFGAPVGLQLAMEAPSNVLGLIIQNANAHRTGWGPGWEATRAFWADPSPANEEAATEHLTLEGTRNQYVAGVPPDLSARMSAEGWEADWRIMQRPGRMETQRALIRDYGAYAARFEAIADYLARWQPRAMLLWGRHDAFFELAEVLSWMEDLPRMEAHVLDAGHLLLETHAREATALMVDFLERANMDPRREAEQTSGDRGV